MKEQPLSNAVLLLVVYHWSKVGSTNMFQLRQDGLPGQNQVHLPLVQTINYQLLDQLMALNDN